MIWCILLERNGKQKYSDKEKETIIYACIRVVIVTIVLIYKEIAHKDRCGVLECYGKKSFASR